MTLTQAHAAAAELRTALLDHGVRRVSIELQPGAGGSGWYVPTHRRALSHHIVSRRSQGLTPGLALIKRGRSDLPPPLANLYGGFDLVSRIISMGWANHPGQGGPRVYDGLLIPANNGRPYLLGTEFEGGLDDADWPDEFREFMARHNAGVCDYLGTGADGHDEHSGWAEPRGRKIDRRGYTTASGRAEIRRFWTPPAAAPTRRTLERIIMGLFADADERVEFVNAVREAGRGAGIDLLRLVTSPTDADGTAGDLARRAVLLGDRQSAAARADITDLRTGTANLLSSLIGEVRTLATALTPADLSPAVTVEASGLAEQLQPLVDELRRLVDRLTPQG